MKYEFAHALLHLAAGDDDIFVNDTLNEVTGRQTFGGESQFDYLAQLSAEGWFIVYAGQYGDITEVWFQREVTS